MVGNASNLLASSQPLTRGSAVRPHESADLNPSDLKCITEAHKAGRDLQDMGKDAPALFDRAWSGYFKLMSSQLLMRANIGGANAAH